MICGKLDPFIDPGNICLNDMIRFCSQKVRKFVPKKLSVVMLSVTMLGITFFSLMLIAFIIDVARALGHSA